MFLPKEKGWYSLLLFNSLEGLKPFQKSNGVTSLGDQSRCPVISYISLKGRMDFKVKNVSPAAHPQVQIIKLRKAVKSLRSPMISLTVRDTKMLNKNMEHDLIKAVKDNLIKSMQTKAENF